LSANPIPCLNQTVVADLRALSKARGRDLIGELSATFFSVLPERIRAIRSAAVIGDARAFAAGAHKLKGGAACIGGDRLAALCGMMESIGNEGLLQEADTLIEELSRETEDLREAFMRQGAEPGEQP
jgi:HPt (histidine-containing phosphotransfer) domain-containing protein